MLQFIVQFLPLIFLCAAFGVVLLNFDAVAAYLVYVISMLTQPRELLQATNQLNIPLPPPTEKRKFTIFTPFIRVYTLFAVLFFPDLDIEKITGKRPKAIKDVAVNVYNEKTKQEVEKYHIKTYSVPNVKNMKNFKSALDPRVEQTSQISSTFQQAFPDVVNILNKINKIDDQVNYHPQVIPMDNNIADTLPEFHAYSGANDPNYVATPPPAAVVPQVVVPTVIPDPVTATTVQEVIPPIARSESPKANSNTQPEKFDAIAALEKKVSELKQEKVKTLVSQVNYGDLSVKSTEVNNTKINIPMPATQSAPLPILTSSPSTTKSDETHVYNPSLSIPLPSLNIFPMIGKLLMYTILSLPLLVVVGSIAYYLVQNRFNFGSLGGYPGWVSGNLESFVKTYILHKS